MDEGCASCRGCHCKQCPHVLQGTCWVCALLRVVIEACTAESHCVGTVPLAPALHHALSALLLPIPRQAIKRAQLHQLSRPSLGVGAGASEDGEQQQYDAELGDVRLHPSYPASLEREGFVRSSSTLGGRGAAAAGGGGSYSQLPPSSPGANGSSSKDAAEFELRAVGASNGKEAAADGRLLSVTAASGSGSSLPLASSSSLPLVGRLQTLGLPGRTGSQQPKQKISPKASLERMDSKYGSLEGDELGELGSARDLGSARAVRRHGSSGGERPML